MSSFERNDECILRSSLRLKEKNLLAQTETEREWKRSPFFKKQQDKWNSLKEHCILDFFSSQGCEDPEQKEFNMKNSERVHFSIYGLSEKSQREYQEDRFIVCNFNINKRQNAFLHGMFTLVAVFDGHGGNFCSSWLSQTAPYYLIETLCDPDIISASVPASIYHYFERLNKEWDALSQIYSDYSGSTQTMWLYHHQTEKQYFANLGDSRTIVIDALSKNLLFETNDHDFSEREMARIQKRSNEMFEQSHGKTRINITTGGGTQRIEGILALSRAHGDNQPELYSKPFGHKVDKVPDVAAAPSLAEEVSEVIILGSDGVWDECSTENAVKMVESMEKVNLNFLASLIDSKIEESSDNKTFVIIHLKRTI